MRAKALPPDERRAAIVDATLPLLLEHGSAVTTRQIAEAAGIAEGTIFRVFPDKDSLVEAVVQAAFDPAPIRTTLATIDPALALSDRLEIAVAALQERISRVWQLVSAVGYAKPPGGSDAAAQRRQADVAPLAALIEPDRDQLCYDPITAAELLRSITFAASHPSLGPTDPLTAAEVVALFLHGASSHRTARAPSLRHEDPTC